MTETVEKTENEKNLLTAFVAGFKNMFDFKTRASKYDYWAFVFANILFSLILLVAGMLLSPLFPIMALYGGIIIYYAYSIVEFIAVLALSVRRLHDTNHSGKILWLPLVFGLGIVLGIALLQYMKNIGSTFLVLGIGLFAASMLVFFGVALWIFILCLRNGQTEENSFGKPVEESEKYNKIANIYIVSYLAISIAFSALSVALEHSDQQDEVVQNTSTADAVSNETSNAADVNADSNADVETQEPAAEEPAEAETEAQPENSAEVETPNIPMHESAE